MPSSSPPPDPPRSAASSIASTPNGPLSYSSNPSNSSPSSDSPPLIASAYIGKHDLLLYYRKVLFVVPKVWRRLAYTFLSAFVFLLAFNLFAIVVFVFTILIVGDGIAGIICVIVHALAYLAGLIWISVVWHVASVVSMLEDSRRLDAMRRSREHVRGKMGVAAVIFVKMNMAFVGIELAFWDLVVVGMAPLVAKLVYAMAMLVLMSAVVLFALVVQTVVYVCKSYHHESIDKSASADHLEVYMGEYMPLKEKDVQMEQLRV